MDTIGCSSTINTLGILGLRSRVSKAGYVLELAAAATLGFAGVLKLTDVTVKVGTGA